MGKSPIRGGAKKFEQNVKNIQHALNFIFGIMNPSLSIVSYKIFLNKDKKFTFFIFLSPEWAEGGGAKA